MVLSSHLKPALVGSEVMVFIWYKQSNANYILFGRRSCAKVTILIVYVDDIVVVGNDSNEISQLKKFLGQEFTIKDL